MLVDRWLESPKEAAGVVKESQGNFPPEQSGDGLTGELGGLGGDDAVQIPQGEVAQLDGPGASGRIRAGNDESLRLEVNPAAWLVDDGGRHGGKGQLLC